MPYQVTSSALRGIDSVPVFVQIDSNPGLHEFTIVGLGDKAVQESIDRIEASIKHMGFISPRAKNRRYVINLAPADLKKEGPRYDLAIAVAYLIESKQLVASTEGIMMLGELGLDGALAHTNGVLSTTLLARELGIPAVIVPSCNAREAALVEGITVYGATDLREVVGHLSGSTILAPVTMDLGANVVPTVTKSVPTVTNLAPRGAKSRRLGANLSPRGAKLAPRGDTVAPAQDDSFAYIRGQQAAKRALVIAAAGGHNALMCGSPGSGKTLLARSVTGLLPPLDRQETIEVAQVHSAAGLLRGPGFCLQRPFFAPHHTASPAAVIGGGTNIRPGQVSLAHRGVLFLDEMPEFARNVLEALRQPLEDGIITVSRASGTVTLPAKFMLIGAMNPCPCGNAGSPSAICSCTVSAITKYTRRISGPLFDRMDIQLFVSREPVAHAAEADFDSLVKARAAIGLSRERQRSRYRSTGLVTNSEMSHKTIDGYAKLDTGASRLLHEIVNKKRLSLRAYHKIQKVARTIADLEDVDSVSETHIAEALSLRLGDSPLSH